MDKTYYVVKFDGFEAPVALDGPNMTGSMADLVVDRMLIPRDGRHAGSSPAYDADGLHAAGFDPDEITVPDAVAGGDKFCRTPGNGFSGQVRLFCEDTDERYLVLVPEYLTFPEHGTVIQAVQALLEQITGNAFAAGLLPAFSDPHDVTYESLLLLPGGFLRSYGLIYATDGTRPVPMACVISGSVAGASLAYAGEDT